MRKSGLHKQISSIFDGVPVPQNNDVPENAEPSSEQMQPETQEPTEVQEPTEARTQPEPVAAPKPQQARSSLVKRMSADPSECASAPAIQVEAERPMPLPKSTISPAKTGPSISSQVKKAVFGSGKGSLDARQKKMAGLVGVLCVVFGAVMFFSLGGVGQTKATTANDTSEDQAIPGQGTTKTVRDWTSPQPLPASLRDATSLAPRQTQSTEDSTGSETSGVLVVKGISYSKNHPMAIINDQILNKGESINGVTIIGITKDTVEFEANEKRWTQQVQR